MEKTKRILAVLMAVLMLVTAFPTSVFAVATETDPISIAKNEFDYEESIPFELYLTVGSASWVGIYENGAILGQTQSIFWQNISDLSQSSFDLNSDMETHFINGGNPYFDSYVKDGKFTPGKYKIVYYKDGGYDPLEIETITIKSNVKGDLTLNKTEFCVDEPIMSTATGIGGSWVGVYAPTQIADSADAPGTGSVITGQESIIWYYCDGGFLGKTWKTGETYDLLKDAHNNKTGNLPAGKYAVCYFDDAGNDYSKRIDIEVKEHSFAYTTVKATFEADGTITGKCSNCGSDAVAQTIKKATAELEYTTVTEDGTEKTPSVTVKDGDGNVLAIDTDYTVTYSNNVNAGTAKATVTFTSTNERYEGSVDLQFTINPSSHAHSFSEEVVTKASFDKAGKIEKKCDCGAVDEEKTVVLPAVSAKLEKDIFLYDNTAKTPVLVVTDTDKNTWENGKDYTAKIESKTEIGNYTVTVTLKKENYEGTKTLNYSISGIITDKTVYEVGEPIVPQVYKDGEAYAWVGFFLKDDYPEESAKGGDQSLNWQYVSSLGNNANFAIESNGLTSGRIYRGDVFASKYSTCFLPGEYKLIYFVDGGYTAGGTIYITIKADSEPEEKNLALNKNEFCVGEPILTTADGYRGDVVAIFNKSETLDTSKPLFWYYVSGGYCESTETYGKSWVSGNEYNLLNTVKGLETAQYGALPAGEYTVALYNSTSVIAQQDVVINEHSYSASQVTTKATFDADGQISGDCICGKNGVFEVIGKATAELEYTSVNFDATEKTPAVTVKDGKGNALVLDTDYTVAYENNKDVGTATVTVTFTETNARYTGSKTLSFTITDADHNHNYNKDKIQKATFDKDGKIEKMCTCGEVSKDDEVVVIPAVNSIELEKHTYLYDTDEKTPAVTVKNSKGTAFELGKDFTVVYSNNINVGIAKATITLTKENYEGTKDVNFKISTVVTDKEVYEFGEPIMVKSINTGSDWVGIYREADPVLGDSNDPNYVTSFFWAEPKNFAGEYFDLSKPGDNIYSNYAVRPDFTRYWSEISRFVPGNYKIVLFENGGYEILDTIVVTVKEKEVAQGVTISIDKSEYTENDTISVSSTNTTEKDSVAIYAADADVVNDVPFKKAFLDKDGKAQISAKYLKNGSYKAVILFENSQVYPVATSEQFTVTRSEDLNLFVETNKKQYCVGEDIIVSAVGYGTDWVGIYKSDDKYGDEPGTVYSYYWYYPTFWGTTSSGENVYYSIGDNVVINSFANDTKRDDIIGYVLPEGTYKVYLFDDGYYNVIDFKEIEIKAHDYKVVDKKDATCTEKGYIKTKCSFCGDEITKELKVVDHKWNAGKLNSPATCTKNTLMDYECLDCGTKETLSVPGTALDHKYVLKEEKEATCKEDGYKKYVCSNAGCDKPEKTEVIDAAHKYVEKVVIPATCEEVGLSQQVCKFCDGIKDDGSKTLPATGHNLVLNKNASYQADCTKAGLSRYECKNEDCDYFEVKVNGTKKDHTYKEYITKATTSKDGKIETKCSVCSSVKSSSTIKAVSKISLDATSFVYDKNEKTPLVSVKDSAGNKLNRSDYTLEYKNNKALGTATVKVKLKGEKYTGETTLKFTINLGKTTTKAVADKTSVAVSWTAVAGAKEYDLYRKADNGKWTKLTTTKSLKYTDKTAKSDTSYQYKAVAVSGSFKTEGTASEAVKLVNAVSITLTNGATGITVKWTKTSDNASYTVYRRVYSGKKWSGWTQLTTTNKTSYTDKKVASGSKYQYKVTVNGKSDVSSTIMRLARTTVTVTNGNNAVSVKWTKVSGAKTYVVYRSSYDGKKWSSWTKLASTKKRSYNDKKAKAGKTYKYKVVAVNGSYNSADSKTKELVVLKATSPKATVAKNGIALKWTKVSGAKGYYVYRSEYKNGKWTKAEKVATIKSSKTVKYTDNKAKKGVKYRYTVTAYNSNSVSANATTKAITR